MRAATSLDPIYKFITANGGFATLEQIQQGSGLSKQQVAKGLQDLRRKKLVISAGRGSWELTNGIS